MALMKILAATILKNHPGAECYNCGEKFCESEDKVLTVFNGQLYCPECAPIEEIYYSGSKPSGKSSGWRKWAING